MTMLGVAFTDIAWMSIGMVRSAITCFNTVSLSSFVAQVLENVIVNNFIIGIVQNSVQIYSYVVPFCLLNYV